MSWGILKWFLFFYTATTLIANGQMSDREFEKIYLDFHDKYDAGYDPSLEEIETLFKDCPDLERFPHYFIYKGDLLSNKGYQDLGLKYYLIAEKLIDLGYESKKIYDHKPIMYFKLGYAYADLYMPKKLLEYIKKGKSYVKENYSFQTEYDFTELEAIYIYNHTDDKNKAIAMLEALYDKAKLYPESPIYSIINTTRLRTIGYLIEIDNLEKSERLLNELKNDSWLKSIDGDYLRWFYTVCRDFHYKKQEYPKAIQYNDSIYQTSPLELEDKESLFEGYIKLYARIGNDKMVGIYRDSLSNVLKLQRKTRQKSSVLLTEENDKYEKLVVSLSAKNKRKERYWLISILAATILLLASIAFFVKRRRNLKKQLKKERQKVDLLNVNYQQLLKNYQFTTKQLQKIEHALAVEMQKNSSPEIASLHRLISKNISKDLNEKLLSINKLRDQFILNIKERFPDLSNYESLICFYTKMGLTAKEIGQITSLTVRSIQSHQYRIGQKTKKKFDSKLKEFLEQVPLAMF